MVGDFNFRNIDWSLMMDNKEAEECLKVIQDNFLEQVVVEPTRRNNILDLILTNREETVMQVDAGGQLGDSGHWKLGTI